MSRSKPTHLTRKNLGFLLAKASQRWNERLYAAFCREGWPQVRPAYGAILIPLYEEDGLQMGDLARRAGLSKQTMTTMARQMEESRLVRRSSDPADGRALRVTLTDEARAFRPTAERVLAELELTVLRATTPRATAMARTWLLRVMSLGA